MAASACALMEGLAAGCEAPREERITDDVPIAAGFFAVVALLPTTFYLAANKATARSAWPVLEFLVAAFVGLLWYSLSTELLEQHVIERLAFFERNPVFFAFLRFVFSYVAIAIFLFRLAMKESSWLKAYGNILKHVAAFGMADFAKRVSPLMHSRWADDRFGEVAGHGSGCLLTVLVVFGLGHFVLVITGNIEAMLVQRPKRTRTSNKYQKVEKASKKQVANGFHPDMDEEERREEEEWREQEEKFAEWFEYIFEVGLDAVGLGTATALAGSTHFMIFRGRTYSRTAGWYTNGPTGLNEPINIDEEGFHTGAEGMFWLVFLIATNLGGMVFSYFTDELSEELNEPHDEESKSQISIVLGSLLEIVKQTLMFASSLGIWMTLRWMFRLLEGQRMSEFYEGFGVALCASWAAVAAVLLISRPEVITHLPHLLSSILGQYFTAPVSLAAAISWDKTFDFAFETELLKGSLVGYVAVVVVLTFILLPVYKGLILKYANSESFKQIVLLIDHEEFLAKKHPGLVDSMAKRLGIPMINNRDQGNHKFPERIRKPDCKFGYVISSHGGRPGFDVTEPDERTRLDAHLKGHKDDLDVVLIFRPEGGGSSDVVKKQNECAQHYLEQPGVTVKVIEAKDVGVHGERLTDLW